MSDYMTGTRVRDRGKTEEMTEEIQARRQECQFFLCLCVSVLPTCPRGDGGPRQGGPLRR
jgi:hypothetical protein